jgi:WD40 repeat protein
MLFDTATWQMMTHINGTPAEPLTGGLIRSGNSPTGYFELATPTLCRPLRERFFDFGRPGDFSPDGRLLALGGDDVELYDLQRHDTIARLPVGLSETVRFSAAGDAVYTYSAPFGLLRFPLAAAPGGVRVGQPAELGVRPSPDGFKYNWMDRNRKGQVIASMWREGCVVLDPEGRRREIAHLGPRCVSLCPDGHFAAVGHWKGEEASVYDLRDGRECLRLPEAKWEAAQLTFGPDGHWMAASGGEECRFYRVGEWAAPRHVFRVKDANLPCQATFSEDGRFVAVRDGLQTVALLRADTLRRVATLPAPNRGAVVGLALSPDGRRLLVQAGHRPYLWDLAGVQAKLDEMGLAFDWPPYSNASHVNASPKRR